MLQAAIGQIQFAREISLELLGRHSARSWFEIRPTVSPSCWRAGRHLASASTRLLMFFAYRGRPTEDLDLDPRGFRRLYGRVARHRNPAKATQSRRTAAKKNSPMFIVMRVGTRDYRSRDSARKRRHAYRSLSLQTR